MEIVLATNNAHKLKEYRDICIMLGLNIDFLTMEEIGIVSDPLENGKSYGENSLLKAQAILERTCLPVLADDTGIEIEKLGPNFPGIYSHRYLQERNYDLKKISKDCLGSKATFTCYITFVNVDKKITTSVGKVEGEIVSPSGPNGFGYDSIFKPNSSNMTYSEMDSDTKNSLSHRYLAFKELVSKLEL